MRHQPKIENVQVFAQIREHPKQKYALFRTLPIFPIFNHNDDNDDQNYQKNIQIL